MSKYDYAKLRYLNVQPTNHEGHPLIFLNDPLELSPHYALVPPQFGIVLATCDGEHTISDMQRETIAYTGILLSETDINYILAELDKVFFLDNERFAQEQINIVNKYRSAPSRPPTHVGVTYPADPNELCKYFQKFVDRVSPVEELETGNGLFSPHIDYSRGGEVYAEVWQRARKLVREAECIIVFGTDHYGILFGQITPTRQSYATPFGVLPTEQTVVDAIVAAIGEKTAFEEELNHRHEHSIELALNWLHFMRDGEPCPIVPILCGSFSHFILEGNSPAKDKRFQNVVNAIKEATTGRKILTVASGDLAHIGPAFHGEHVSLAEKMKLKEIDEAMLKPVLQGDSDGFFEFIRHEEDKRNVCGTAPLYLAMKLMGDVPGQMAGYDRCVADEKGQSFVSVCGLTF
ncbi:MAG: AmmeMemoRadiSam system protein B [Anaerolineaceae bacterium 4572_78]|nr:MAG: AmmeMemoRadiSam system protein B [Anaerolineaceae bacterium 4572_78]